MFAINQRYKQLETQIELACRTDDSELGPSLRRFGTVLICGFVERSVEVIILERLRSRAHPRVINFVKSHFKRGTNYHCDAICQLLERFEPEWRNKFREFMEKNEGEVEALSSIYSIRNSVAHGGDHGISSRVLEERCADVKKIVDALVSSTQQ